jgi:hypothetical protein
MSNFTDFQMALNQAGLFATLQVRPFYVVTLEKGYRVSCLNLPSFGNFRTLEVLPNFK